MNKLENSVIKYAINFERYKNGKANEVIELLDKSNNEIAKYVRRTNGVHTKARYKEISKKVGEVASTLKKKTDKKIDVDGVIEYELAKEEVLLETAKPYIQKVKGGEVSFLFPTVEQIKTSALFKPIDTKYGMTYQSYLEGLQNGLYNTWDVALRTGYLTGQTSQQIVSTVMGTARQIDKLSNPGTMNSFRNSIYGNTRTVLQSFANETMQRVYEDNEQYFGDKDDNGVFYKYEYLATLDSRTCLVCADASSRLYKELKDVPNIPQHRGCRCVVIPYFNIEGDTKASKNGQVGADITFSKWLEDQDEKTQKEILGSSRYELFKNGTSIKQFVDNGSILTLDELEARLNGSAE